MNIVDFLLLAGLAVVMPIYGGLSFRRYLKRIADGLAPNKIAVFRDAMTLQWSLFATLVVLWLWAERDFADLGLEAVQGQGAAIGFVLVLVVTSYLLIARRQARAATTEDCETVESQLGELKHFLPGTRKQLHWFYALSVTAGIVEELLYRGYFFWMFAPHMPVWAVLLLSSAIFGIGHSYQGVGGMLRVFLIGLCFGGLYILTGSIWIPILAHALFDILQGAIIYEYFRPDRASQVEKNAAA